MPVYKRFKQKTVKRGMEGYDKATWYARGAVNGERYNLALPEAKTKADADALESLLVGKLRQGELDLERDKTTLKEFVDDVYLPHCKQHNESYKQKEIETDNLIKFFKNVRLRAITPTRIEAYKQWRLTNKAFCQKCHHNLHPQGEICTARTVSPSTVNRDLATLSALFSTAVRHSKIKENPMQMVKKFPEPEPRTRFLTPDEKERLLRELESGENRQMQDIVLIALLTGWRKGQILGIQKADLDSVTQSVLLQKSKRSARRHVPVSSAVWEILSSLAGTRTDYLFINSKTGGKLGDFKKTWWNILEKVGIKNDFHFHDLRHSFATDLLRLGAREFQIQAALGHASIKTTRGYAHVQDDDLRVSLNLLGERLNQNARIIPASSLISEAEN